MDTEYVEPETEATVRWGKPEGTSNPAVERHEVSEIRATVALVPYTEERR